MCFRPPSAEAGERPCPHCFVVALPNAEGKCPECGEAMNVPGAVSGPIGAPKAPNMPSPTPPKTPKTSQ